MSKRAKEKALEHYASSTNSKNESIRRKKLWAYALGYEQAEKDVWNKIEKYLSKRDSSDFATVGWILKNIEEYKKKIMEEK